jgi:hypothetical protein
LVQRVRVALRAPRRAVQKQLALQQSVQLTPPAQAVLQEQT